MEPSATSIENFIFRESKKEDGPVISHDPNVRPLMISGHSAYVNRFEKWVSASNIVKISLADFDFIYPGLSAEKGAEKLLDMGPSLVAVTMGGEGGAVFVKRNGAIQKIFVEAYHSKIIDTIGAGDTFHGAFLSWLEKQQCLSRKALELLTENEIREALCFANKAAAIVCSRKGAEPPSLFEIDEFTME
jgi:fructokinase